MAKVSLTKIVSHCDRTLRTAQVQDYDGASNGLQVENGGTVSRIAAAVDASVATVKLAVKAKADLLIVHHGLFWSATHPWTGKRRELLELLVKNDLAVYAPICPWMRIPNWGTMRGFARRWGFGNCGPSFLTRAGSSDSRRPRI